MNKISIIVPVYNVEKYLVQCVESIVMQSYKNIEVILVDDGSKDTSPEICDALAEKYDCIKVVHKENGGLSDARNTGIRLASGEYILFVDSDDFIEPDSISAIAEVVENNPVDVVFLEAQKYFPDTATQPLGDGITKEGVANKSKNEVLKFIASCPKMPASAWSKMIRRDMVLKNELFFEIGLISEDVEWCFRLLLAAEKFEYCPVMYYNYRQARGDSITKSFTAKRIEDTFYIVEKWLEKSHDLLRDEKEFVLSELAYEYPMLMLIYAHLPKEDKQKYRERMKNLAFLLNYRNSPKYKLIRILYKVIGLDCVCFLLKNYMKVR